MQTASARHGGDDFRLRRGPGEDEVVAVDYYGAANNGDSRDIRSEKEYGQLLRLEDSPWQTRPTPHRYNKDIIDIYESGKHRRYGLLFAMNGAGYTLAVFLFDLAPRMATPVVGYLLLVLLAVVLGRFSRLMGADIDAFGKRMRDLDKLVRGAPELELYGPIGQKVLASFWTAL